jgi:hypothetical protein
MTSPDYIWLFAFVLISYGLLHIIKVGLGQWLKWDVGERERVLQHKLSDLQQELEKAKEKIVQLERLITLLQGQYDDAVVRLAQIKLQYERATAEAKELREEMREVKDDIPLRAGDAHRRRLLIAAVGTKDSGLELDIASLRAVKMETGLEFERILEATPEKLKNSLDRARRTQSQTYVHMSVHSDKSGYLLGEQVVDANWLSSVMDGVIVLLVAGCESTWVGEFLGVVPYVVSMSEEVTSQDAAKFTRAFWTEIGKGLGPSLSLKRALQRAPSSMGEYVISHWTE